MHDASSPVLDGNAVAGIWDWVLATAALLRCLHSDCATQRAAAGVRNRHWLSPMIEATILRMTGAASSTMGRSRTHDSNHSPRNVLRDSEECATATATADVSPDWVTPKIKGP